MSLNKSLYILLLAVIIVLYGANIATHGMFTDGTIYATIAHNMHMNAGDIWHPYFSDYIMNTFHEHPTLAFWLQSLTYKILGNAFWVDKVYQVIMLLLNIVVIIAIWKAVFKSKKMAWLPVLLWITIGKVIWSFNNNCLENTLCLFSLLAILVLIKQQLSKSNLLWSWALSSLLLWLAFFSKGFPGLFPLGFYFAWFISQINRLSIKQFMVNTLGLLLVFSAFGSVFFLLNNDAYINISTYINTQVLESIAGERVIVSRTWILQVMFNELIPLLLLLAIYFTTIKIKKRVDFIPDKITTSWALFFLMVGLMASLPIIVSPKQLSFYVIPSTPYFVLAGAILMSPMLNSLSKVKNLKVLKRVRIATITILFGSVAFAWFNAGKYMRNKSELQDLAIIAKEIKAHNENVVMLSPALIQDWSVMSYLKRYYNINTNRSGEFFPYRLSRLDESTLEYYNVINSKYQTLKLEKQQANSNQLP